MMENSGSKLIIDFFRKSYLKELIGQTDVDIYCSGIMIEDNISIFFTIFLYVWVLEAIWVLLWTMKGIIWKCMVHLILVIFSVMLFFWLGEDGVFLGLFPSQFNPLPTKNPGMLHTVGFKILSRLWILNFHLPKMAWQILIML